MIDRFDGHLNQVDTGDKGCLLMLLFGTPVAHEDDEERAVRCCLERSAAGGPFRAGVTTGSAFCGEIGPELRRYYTVVGDSVNLASRLLQAARPGQLLIDGPTFDQVESEAVGERLQPMTVKGKAGPVTVWAVRAARDRQGSSCWSHCRSGSWSVVTPSCGSSIGWPGALCRPRTGAHPRR